MTVLLGTGGKQADMTSAMCNTPDCFQTCNKNSFMGLATVVKNTIISLHGSFLIIHGNCNYTLKALLNKNTVQITLKKSGNMKLCE